MIAGKVLLCVLHVEVLGFLVELEHRSVRGKAQKGACYASGWMGDFD